MLSLLTTFLTCFLALSSIPGTSAAPAADLATRGVYSPALVSPDTNTVWGVGSYAVVTWDASKVPKDQGNFDSVDLYSSANGKETLVTSLSTGFDSHSGAVGFTVPSSVAPGTYYVKIGSSSSAPFDVAATTVTYLPTITGPAANATLKVGEKWSINWDTAAVPANPAQLPYVDLYMETPSGGSLFVSRVATNVDVKGGSVNIVVPEARPGKYFFMVGAYGHNSEHFTITA